VWRRSPPSLSRSVPLHLFVIQFISALLPSYQRGDFYFVSPFQNIYSAEGPSHNTATVPFIRDSFCAIIPLVVHLDLPSLPSSPDRAH
jgi:hypothetical protein